ncbi:MAG: hypothetical protein R8P61_08530 [Bacteroidia bacterium]|nr:hypothetical protein [Bacteroidia bacterium]
MNTIIRISISLILFFQVYFPLSAQDAKEPFEGKINYSLKFVDKTGELNEAMVKLFIGDEQLYTVKREKYKNDMNGKFKFRQAYLGNDTMYTQYLGNKFVLWTLSSEQEDSLLSYEIIENAEEINGISCHLLQLKTRNGSIDYYYHPDYRLDSEDYKVHESGFWSFFVEKTGCLPLKSVVDTEEEFTELIFKEIMPMKIEDSEFAVPVGPRKKASEE